MAPSEIGNEERLTNQRIVLAGVLGYCALLLLMAVSGTFMFVTKTSVVPVLLLIAIATGRGRTFVNQWAVFLSLLVLFDSTRGYIFYVIKAFDLNVYMNYAIEWERALLGDAVAPIWVQSRFLNVGELTLLDRVLTVVHGSHFLLFLLFGWAVWYLGRKEFEAFKAALLFIMGIGLLVYFLVPTVPPWMAANDFAMLPEVHHAFYYVYNRGAPTLSAAFDINPIAAMPSLHTAFPTLITLVAFRLWRWKATPMLLYLLVMIAALLYGGEHYVVDEIAGALLAVIAFLMVYRWDWHVKVAATLHRHTPTLRTALKTETQRKLAITTLVLLVAEALGQTAVAHPGLWYPSADFVQREVAGRSEVDHLLFGNAAYRNGEYRSAQKHYVLAVSTASTPERRRHAQMRLGWAAMENGDYETVVNALHTMPVLELGEEGARALSAAHYRLGQPTKALAVMARQTHTEGTLGTRTLSSNRQ